MPKGREGWFSKMKKTNKEKQSQQVSGKLSPCMKCNDREKFDFSGCVQRCPKYIDYLKTVVFPNHETSSPCNNLRCGVPGVRILKGERIGCPNKCRLTEVYAERTKVVEKSSLVMSYAPMHVPAGFYKSGINK